MTATIPPVTTPPPGPPTPTPTRRPGTPGARVAWIVIGSVLATVALAFGTVQVVAQLAHEEHDEHRVVSTPVRSIDVRAAGSVTVVGSSRPSTTIDAHVSDGLESPSRSIEVHGDRLVIRSSCGAFFGNFCGVDYTIHVPSGVTVVAHASQGSVTTRGPLGDLTLSSSQGSVRVNGGSGTLDLHSSQGNVTATSLTSSPVTASSSQGGVNLSFRSVPDTVDARSSQGSITVELPRGSATYAVDASASQGSSHVLVRTDPESHRTVSAHSSQGNVTVRHPGG